MSYKVIVDSCGEFTPEMKADGGFEHVALGIQIEDTQWTDDDSLKQEELLLKIAESTSCAKTSCPSPERYMESYHCDAERIYVVTLSAELSGSYNSAVLGKNLYEEEYGEKQIHVFNSRSASVGETLIALKVQQCEKAGMTFEEVVESVECYIEEQHTYFVLENLDTLRKNGRLTGIKSLVAGALNIKPIMGSTPQEISFLRSILYIILQTEPPFLAQQMPLPTPLLSEKIFRFCHKSVPAVQSQQVHQTPRRSTAP